MVDTSPLNNNITISPKVWTYSSVTVLLPMVTCKLVSIVKERQNHFAYHSLMHWDTTGLLLTYSLRNEKRKKILLKYILSQIYFKMQSILIKLKF